jgi:meiotically up-regulated gene 157 (Mug157) protein
MWLRDSANQLKSYLPVLSANNTIGSLYRGAINLQARYLNESFFCQAFQPPAESQISPSTNGAVDNDNVTPSYDNNTVFECKWELDSVASFLDLSANYYRVTNDSSFFSNYQWTQTVQSILNQSYYLQNSTYSVDGSVTNTPYTFTRLSSDSEGTQDNSGLGNAFENTGLIRSWFRPSDDATIYQGFIPANMMFSSALSSSVSIANAIGEADLADQMSTLAKTVSKAIQKWGVKKVATVDGQTTSVYAFEVDGYGSQNIMDDANLPSLLGAPVYGYVGANDTTFQATRKLLLSSKNPYYGNGSVIAGIGSPHTGFGRVWPMSLIVRIMTSDDDEEIISTLELLLGSTGGTGTQPILIDNLF